MVPASGQGRKFLSRQQHGPSAARLTPSSPEAPASPLRTSIPLALLVLLLGLWLACGLWAAMNAPFGSGTDESISYVAFAAAKNRWATEADFQLMRLTSHQQ
jgi:hypothetical protein